ncbi:UDP-N-acetylmuramyl pentapeptide synthase [Anaerobranca californiensis DSM 14826]|uniref:UDP-N-acetylmuramyl pentapeptide synthase n=1 Tax=Anaerobranca californiensis DSM 14826 TaxID=1120989 RepID=A0A1M6NZI0_9FIRM|nr:Mur ligase family protein [Anaerobranca californiensis]SHK01093.1 UDP-N-acetylmuramyl pentapeptide synthase [Anaerobranca californiensis DSM 14826]
MAITVSEIVKVTGGELIQGREDYFFHNIFYDVIKDQNIPKNSLYIPYINSYRNIDTTSKIATIDKSIVTGLLIDKGIKDIDFSSYPNVILVDNLEEGVLKIAHYLREREDYPIIAVTGSSGKTTSKELIANILESTGLPYKKTLRNINGYGGAATTIFSLEKNQWGVLEVGVNGLKRLPLLAKTISPNYLLVTNIYHTHFDKFPRLEEVAKYKLSLAKFMKEPQKKVLCGDNPYLREYIDINTITFGLDNTNHYYLDTILSSGEKGSSFIVRGKGKTYRIKTPLIGKHNIVNIIGVLALTLELGLEEKGVIKGIENFSGISDDYYSTISLKKVGKWTFLDDSQHFNLPALKVGLETFRDISKEGGVLLLSYDYKFASPNFNIEELFQILLQHKRSIKGLILMGEGWKKWLGFISKEICPFTVCLKSKEEVAIYIQEKIIDDTVIYMKGDFHHHLRGIINILEENS